MAKKILVVGAGGREHALAWKLSQESEVVCAPGNPGIAQEIETAPVKASDPEGIVDLAKKLAADLVVVGPEDPLIAGLADKVRAAGFAVFGPDAAAAQLEGSKQFSKELMKAAGVPTASFASFSNPQDATEYARAAFGGGRMLVVKASGTALGRGVVVADSLIQAEEAIEAMMVRRIYGASGDTVVLEERLAGREFSLLTLIGDQNFVSLPLAQDYKRAFDGDQGPNTGGMGTYSPCDWVSSHMVSQVEAECVAPILAALRSKNIGYRGVLFTGMMVTPDGPKCLEYNCRFGDPEIQSVVMRLGKGLSAALESAANGGLIESPEVAHPAAVTVIVAGTGYPTQSATGQPLTVGPLPDGSKLFFAGVGGQPGTLTASGGRVVAASAFGVSVPEARGKAFEAAKAVSFEGVRFRSDIAAGVG